MSIHVVYLSYYNESAHYDFEMLESFLGSYENRSAGIEHSLTIIAKNWTDKDQYENLCKRAKQVGARVIDLPDDGWDFGAYFGAANILEDEYLFFIGSSSFICSDNWLSLSYGAFESDESVQLVGPMGSWGDLKKERFPNYHIRTCCFMIKRELFLEFASAHKFPVTKEDTYELEHGENSLTKFVLNKGYKAVVVNSDGQMFLPELWPFSSTYRAPWGMKSLLIDVHGVFYYDQVDNDKRFLERAAWGWSLKDTQIKIFVAHHKPAILLESDVFQPIFNGSNTFKTSEYGLRDNFGINIAEKNERYRQLTGHYFLWKNILPYIENEYIGFFHYNKFLDFNISLEDAPPFAKVNLDQFTKMCADYSEENIMKCVQGFDVVLPRKSARKKDQTQNSDLVLNIISENCPEYTESAKKVLSSDEFYAHLIFVMKRELVCEYMQWLFPLLESAEQKLDVNSYDIVDIAENSFNIWLTHNIEAKALKVFETTSVQVDGMLKQQAAPTLF